MIILFVIGSLGTALGVIFAAKEMGKTVFMSTHILEIAERVCDRVGIINEGRLVSVGSIPELREQSRQKGGSLEDIFLKLGEEEEAQAEAEARGEEAAS